MAHAGADRNEHAARRVRAGRAARGRGDDDARPVPVTVVTLYVAPECHLCERALEVVHQAEAELGFELILVDIDEDPELEARYREHLPVVEIDGERAFTHFVDPVALRERLAR